MKKKSQKMSKKSENVKEDASLYATRYLFSRPLPSFSEFFFLAFIIELRARD